MNQGRNKLDLTGMLSADAYQKWTDNGQKIIASLTARKQSNFERMWVYDRNARTWTDAGRDFQRFKREARSWAKSDAGQVTALVLAGVSALSGGLSLLTTGVAPLSIGFGAVAAVTGGVSTTIDCTNGASVTCGVGMVGTVIGVGGAGAAIGSLVRLSANAGRVGFNLSGIGTMFGVGVGIESWSSFGGSQ